MPQDNPLVSIALCTFNGEKYLKQQLISLLNQTYDNIEIIIIDDCSTDASLTLIKELTNSLKNVRIERNVKNLGFIKNFEKAISYCKGEYIAICDQDDIWSPFKIKILVEEIGDNNLIFHDSLLIDAEGNLIKNLKVSDKTRIYEGSSNLYFLASNCISGHACMFKKELLSYVLPFDKRFFYDWWIAFVAASIGTIKFIPDTLVSYRQHNNNITDILMKKPQIQQPGNIYFTYNISWIEHASQFKHLNNAAEINYIYNILLDYSKGKKGINFLIFLLKYYTKLFNLKSKTFFSKLNLIRKIYFSRPIILRNT